MSPAQAEALAKARQAPETLGVGVMHAPEATVAAYALTGGQDEKTSCIVIPISECQQVTIERNTVIRTDKGVIWQGVVEDTGESAILLWSRDGRLTGVLGYKGHIYMVMNMGGEQHAVPTSCLVVDDPRGCGLSTRVAPDPDEAYFVVHYSCAAITISIAHEIARILGARHHRQFDPTNTPFRYAHGYVNGTKWRNIMSYAESCEGCLRIPYWSNPRVLFKGEPTGTLTEDNARVILEQAERVSKFR
jgi:hypothetical protein